MYKQKFLNISYFAYIIGLFWSLLLSNAYAARWASVTADKAEIYSDIEMTSVIGYIRKGKKVRVGEVAGASDGTCWKVTG